LPEEALSSPRLGFDACFIQSKPHHQVWRVRSRPLCRADPVGDGRLFDCSPACVPEEALAPKPVNMTFEEAAAILFGCLSALSFPRKAARKNPALRTRVRLDTSGKIRAVSVSGVHATIESEVKERMFASSFSTRCAGSTIRLIFVYELAGNEEYGPPRSTVVLMAPNRFVIRSHPPMVIPD
jgi:hypothetical protein